MAREPGGCEGRERTVVPVFDEDRARNSRDPRHAEAPLSHAAQNMGAAQKPQVGLSRAERAVAAMFAGGAELALYELQRLEQTAKAAADVPASDPVVRAASRQGRSARLHTLTAVLGSVPGISAAYIGWPNGDFMLLRPVGRGGERLRPPAAAR